MTWQKLTYRILLIILLGTQLFACSVFSGKVPLPVTEDDKELVVDSEAKIKSNVPLITFSNTRACPHSAMSMKMV